VRKAKNVGIYTSIEKIPNFKQTKNTLSLFYFKPDVEFTFKNAENVYFSLFASTTIQYVRLRLLIHISELMTQWTPE